MPAPLQAYLLRTVYEWILEDADTPEVLCVPGPGVRLPEACQGLDQVVLNIHPQAVMNLLMDEHGFNFQARFQGKSHPVVIPMGSVRALYGRNSRQGLRVQSGGSGFVLTTLMSFDETEASPTTTVPPSRKKRKVPHLRLVK